MEPVNREAFEKAVKLVLPGVAKKELFVQANKLGIRSGNLFSYNDEISICHEFPEISEIDGAVDGLLLYELLGRVTTEKIEVIIHESELEFRSAGGKMKARLKMLPFELPISEIDIRGEWTQLPEPTKDFTDTLKLIGGICAIDMSRPVLTCVNIGNDWVEGTDGYRLAKKQYRDLPGFLLPSVTAMKIAEYDVKKLAIGRRGEWVHFGTDVGTVVSSRIFSSKYPDLTGQYDVNGVDFKFPGERIIPALERAQVFARREHKIDEEISVSLHPKRIVIKANGENGSFEETVGWQHVNITVDFNIHPDFFQLALQQGVNCRLDQSRIKFIGDGWDHVVALR